MNRLRCYPLTAMLSLLAVLALLAVPPALGANPLGIADADADADANADQDVTFAIEREMLGDPSVPANEIDIVTRNGIVTLRGTVSDVLAKERAAGLAMLVKGVRAVVNEIEVEPRVLRTDRELAQAAENALLADPATDSYELTVTASDGEITLAGEVESWQEMQLAANVVRSVSGVTGLVNRIVVDYERERPDREIETEIEQTLRWDALVDHALVEVEVADRKAELTGIVGSAAEKQRARMHAWTAGVRVVDDSGLDVARWARDADLRTDKYSTRPDGEIEQAAEAALSRDPRVFSFDVEVDVESGVATLSGRVDNLKARRAAEQDVENTVGVFSVVNLIKVRPTGMRSGDEIETGIRSALLRDPNVDRYEITVDVEDGIASLFGTVDSWFEKALADDIASRTKGVTEVRNHLAVLDGSYQPQDPLVYPWMLYDYEWYDPDPRPAFVSDRSLEQAVESELFWSPFVSADDIEVSVEDGVVTLEGTVDSWREWGAARDNALQAGATQVRNRVTVDREAS